LIGGDAGESVRMSVQITHLRLEDSIETDIGHENCDDGDVGHAPFAGLEGEVVDDLVLCPFVLAEEGDAGGEQLGDGEEDTEGEDEDADKDGVILPGRE